MGFPPHLHRNALPVILLADDDAILRDLMQIVLRIEGYEVINAADGGEILELSRALPGTIDLLLTDVDMTRMDGVSAHRQINTERLNMKVLFMSGSLSGKMLVPETLPFLLKPFQRDELSKKVREVLEADHRVR